jgi:hypothetical protein
VDRACEKIDSEAFSALRAAVSRYLPNRLKRSIIAPQLVERLIRSQTVAGGPFRGMRYHGDAVCGAAAPKIMGVYEIELAPVLRKWSAIPFRHVINAGAAEGYYAVGCAMRWPHATVTAFESNQEGRRLLTRNVELNGLQTHVNVIGRCSQDELQAAIPSGQPCLIIMDVEGAEGELLNPRNVPGLADSHIIVEIHDFIDERLGDLVLSQLQSTHVVEEVRTRKRVFLDFHEPRAAWRRLLLLPYLKQYADELRPGPMRWFCCSPVTAIRLASADRFMDGAVRGDTRAGSNQPYALQARGNNKTRSILRAQRKALARKFAPGLLRPFSGMNVSVRLGEFAQTVLSRWPISPQPAKLNANFCYLAVIDRNHWLMLRESLCSLYRSWNSLPNITVVSDGSWGTEEFAEVFAWWPASIKVLMRSEVCQAASSTGFPELADYARESPYGLKFAAIVTQAAKQPVLFVDADILWFRDPTLLLREPVSWEKPRALRETNCHQRREMAIRHCVQVLEPPFVNSGIVALHGELMPAELLRSMVKEALADPLDSRCEQTIIAAAVKLGGDFFPDKLSLVEFDDVHRLRSRDMWDEGYYSRHYVNWMRHMLYRDAFKLRLGQL